MDDHKPVAKMTVPEAPPAESKPVKHIHHHHYHRFHPTLVHSSRYPVGHYHRYYDDAPMHDEAGEFIFDLEQEADKIPTKKSDQPKPAKSHRKPKVKQAKTDAKAEPEKKDADPAAKPDDKKPDGKQPHWKLSPEEIESLRVQHGLQYEREHSVDHFIEEVTHPEYKLTGWISGKNPE